MERQPRHRLDVSIGHDAAGRIEHAIRTSAYDLADVVYGDKKVTLTLQVETSLLGVAEGWVAEITNGGADVIRADVEWVDVPVKPTTDRDGDV